MTDKKPKGFARMSPEKRREIAARGGANLPPEKRSFSVNRALAAAAGRKGGFSVAASRRSFSLDPELARAAGQKGGKARKNMKEPESGKPPTPPPPPEPEPVE